MTWSVQNYLDRTRSIADAAGAGTWDDTIDVLPALGMAHTREWKRILDANEYYRTNDLSLATDTNSQIALSSLDAGAGDSQKRLFRILWVSDGNYIYAKVDRGQVPLITTSGTVNTGRLWYRDNTILQIIPKSSGQTMQIVVNHTPTPIDQLSGSGIAVEFPRDYELVLCYEAAAWMHAKGGAATNVTADLQRLADQIRSDLLGDVARDSTQPTWMQFPDSAQIWGSE